MKKLWIIALMLVCISGYAQQENMPLEVESAFQAKYTNARIGDWWVEDHLYHIDFIFQGGSYFAVFDLQGAWIETAETISEFEIPGELREYIRSNYPSGSICYCERVENAQRQLFLRIGIIDAGNVDRVIRSDLEGNNIVLQEELGQL